MTFKQRGSTLNLRPHAAADLACERVRQRHVVELFCHLLAVLESPVEELERLVDEDGRHGENNEEDERDAKDLEERRQICSWNSCPYWIILVC